MVQHLANTHDDPSRDQHNEDGVDHRATGTACGNGLCGERDS
jgi:hypothetical protein